MVESFEELKTLFEDMFQDDLAGIHSASQSGATASCSSSMFDTYGKSTSLPSKRNFEMNSVKSEIENSSNIETHFQGFSFGVSAISTSPSLNIFPTYTMHIIIIDKTFPFSSHFFMKTGETRGKSSGRRMCSRKVQKK